MIVKPRKKIKYFLENCMMKEDMENEKPRYSCDLCWHLANTVILICET
jgi:hypothetical protein